MKFLCIPCDQRMKITRADPPDNGSIRAIFACPSCSHQIAMLTNAHETQMVQSVGIKIGSGNADAAESSVVAEPMAEIAAETVAETAAGRAEAGGCPFAGMLGEMEAQSETPEPGDTIAWTAEAAARLENIPEFVRPMAKQGIEHYAKTNGHAVINDAVMEEARGRFGM